MARKISFCSNHPNTHVNGRGLCINCYTKWLKQHNPQYAERQRANHRRYHAKTKPQQAMKTATYYKTHQDELREKARMRWAQLTPEERWAKNLRVTYGIQPTEYAARLAEQNGKCAICHKAPQPGMKLQIDHTHHGIHSRHAPRGRKHIQSQDIRGLLCQSCNILIGWIERHQDKLDIALRYLQRP